MKINKQNGELIITKKDIKEAPSFIVMIDYKLNMNVGYEILAASNMVEAMTEAESYLADDVYLVKLLAKTENTNGYGILYYDQLTNRKYGWHGSDSAHSEGPWDCEYCDLFNDPTMSANFDRRTY